MPGEEWATFGFATVVALWLLKHGARGIQWLAEKWQQERTVSISRLTTRVGEVEVRLTGVERAVAMFEDRWPRIERDLAEVAVRSKDIFIDLELIKGHLQLRTRITPHGGLPLRPGRHRRLSDGVPQLMDDETMPGHGDDGS